MGDDGAHKHIQAIQVETFPINLTGCMKSLVGAESARGNTDSSFLSVCSGVRGNGGLGT